MIHAMNDLLQLREFDSLLVATSLLGKATVLLAVAWCAHFLVRRANPRWRVLLWRSTALGVFLLVALSISPPLFSLAVLPIGEAVTPDIAPMQVESVPPLSDPHWPEGRLLDAASDARTTEVTVVSSMTEPATIYESKASEETRPQPTKASAAKIVLWLGAVWLVGVVLIALRMALGWVRLRRILKRSLPCPDWIARQMDHIAKALHCKRYVDVRRTAEVGSPCLIGAWRPVILLPQEQLQSAAAKELPGVLIHELSHVKARDVVWNWVLYLLGMITWVHPFVWRIRLAHATACDETADSVAANRLGDVDDYIRILARLALRVNACTSAMTLGMTAPSAVRLRIQSLQRRLFPKGLPRRRMLCALVLSTVMVVTLGGVALTRATAEPVGPISVSESETAREITTNAAQESTDPAADEEERGDVPDAAHGLILRAVSKETGAPLPGVTVKSGIFLKLEHQEKELTTSRTGSVTLVWDAGAKLNRLYFTCVKNGYVPVYYFHDDRPGFGALPTEMTLSLEKGRPIGGIVVDEKGQPLPRASVKVRTIATIPKRAYYWNTVAELTTDADGRWNWNGAPSDLGLYSIELVYPGYIDQDNTLQHGMDTFYRMKRGVRLTGRVLTDRDAPINRATVLLGYQHNISGAPRATTDSDGRFIFAECEPGETLITVHAWNRAPQSRKIMIGEVEDAGEFRLNPGRTVRVRVVDEKGHPIENASLHVESWQGRNVLGFFDFTDKVGRVEWTSAG